MNRNRETLIQIIFGILITVSTLLLSLNYRIKEPEYCMDIVYGDKYSFEEYIQPKRNFRYFKLSGETKLDKVELLLIDRISKEMVKSKIDSVGMKIVLGKELSYKTYIELFNVCLKSGVTDWIPYNDTVFIYNIRGSENKVRNCQNSSMPGMNE
jgi:hypothetical protein